MPFMRPDGLEDVRLDPFRALPSSRREQRDGVLVAEGGWLVERMWQAGHPMMSVLVAENRLNDLPDGLADTVPVYVLSAEQLETVVGYRFHRGVLGCGRRKETAPVAELAAQPDNDPSIWLAVDGVVDPENLGGILRNASAFGVQRIMIGARCADPYSRRVLRVSMGNVFRLQLLESSDLARDLAMMRNDFGYEVIATVLDKDAGHPRKIVRPPRLVLVLGSEGHGIDPQILSVCSRRVTIPMHLGTDSLNVATAAALFLYEFSNRLVGERGAGSVDGRPVCRQTE